MDTGRHSNRHSNRHSKSMMWGFVAVVFSAAIVSRPIEARGTSATLREFAANNKASDTIVHELHYPRVATYPRIHDTGMIPIYMSLPGSIQSGVTFTVSVTVGSVPTNGGYVQVGCNQPGLFTSPSGSWPYHLQYAGGSSTTASFSVQSSSSANTSVTVYACTSDADPNDPSQWSVNGTLSAEPAHLK